MDFESTKTRVGLSLAVEFKSREAVARNARGESVEKIAAGEKFYGRKADRRMDERTVSVSRCTEKKRIQKRHTRPLARSLSSPGYKAQPA